MAVSVEKIAEQYAIAFIETAEKRNLLDSVYQDMTIFQKVIQLHPELLQVLDSPIVKNTEKLAVLQAVFKPLVGGLTLDLFSLVNRQNRSNVLPVIVHTSLEQYYLRKKIVRASITTTIKLSNELMEYFKSWVKRIVDCKEVLLTAHINPTIQGGFILRLADRQIDSSLATKLANLKKQFVVT